MCVSLNLSSVHCIVILLLLFHLLHFSCNTIIYVELYKFMNAMYDDNWLEQVAFSLFHTWLYTIHGNVSYLFLSVCTS